MLDAGWSARKLPAATTTGGVGPDPYTLPNMSDSSKWEVDIEGNFPLHKAVVDGMHAASYRLGEADAHYPSDAQRYKDRLGGVLRYISLDENREDLSYSGGRNSEKIFPEGKPTKPPFSPTFVDP